MGIKLVKLQAIEIINQEPSIKDVPKRGGEGQGEKDTNADMGKGSNKGGRPLLVKKSKYSIAWWRKAFTGGNVI